MSLHDDHDLVWIALLKALHLRASLLEGVPFFVSLIHLKNNYRSCTNQYSLGIYNNANAVGMLNKIIIYGLI